MRHLKLALILGTLGCAGVEPVSEEKAIEEFMKDATAYQDPCSLLEEKDRSPKSVGCL